MPNILSILALCFGLIPLSSAKSLINGRIVGGVGAVEGEYPYQVSLRKSGSHICGASIISNRFVLTAGHCVGYEDEGGFYYVNEPKDFTIRAGSNNRLNGGVISKVDDIIVHEDYANFLHDLALLRLETQLIFSNNIRAIPLANNEVPTGDEVIISGWGRLTTFGDIPTKLQWNKAEVLSRLSCLSKIGMYSDALLCLAHPADNGACFGDSGGPAAYKGKLVGVASFVVGGCGSASPDGYAKVYNHVDWIKKYADLPYQIPLKKSTFTTDNFFLANLDSLICMNETI